MVIIGRTYESKHKKLTYTKQMRHLMISNNLLLAWKIFIIFQAVVVGRFHSITPSLPVRHLETRVGGAPIWKGKECWSENLNLTPTGDLCERCLSFILPLKDATYHRFRWYATLEKKTPAETFPKFPSIIHVINRSDRNPPITAR